MTYSDFYHIWIIEVHIPDTVFGHSTDCEQCYDNPIVFGSPTMF